MTSVIPPPLLMKWENAIYGQRRAEIAELFALLRHFLSAIIQEDNFLVSSLYSILLLNNHESRICKDSSFPGPVSFHDIFFPVVIPIDFPSLYSRCKSSPLTAPYYCTFYWIIIVFGL